VNVPPKPMMVKEALRQSLAIEDGKSLDRRDVIRGGALLAVAAAGVAVVSTEASANDETMRDLWRRFIAAEVQFADAYSAQDAAEWNARQELIALACPWTPMCEEDIAYKADQVSPHRMVIEKVASDLTMREGGSGPWLVWEYQPRATDHPFVKRRLDGNPTRWQPYPEAKSADDAYAMATARAEKEWRSLNGKWSAIARRHQVRKFEAGVDAVSEACCAVRREIAEAPVTGALALAIKLGVWAYGNDIDLKSSMAGRHASNFDEIEMAALLSVYKHAVSECGFDPMTRARETMRKHYKASA
jgi:hypothetical protein